MTAADEGGEAPCFAHLLDDPSQLSDESLAGLAVLPKAGRRLASTHRQRL